MSESIEEQIADIRKQIEVTSESKNKINRLRQLVEEDHYKELKRIERYMNSESLTESERLDYSEQRSSAKKEFLSMNDKIDDAIYAIDKENEEREEMIHELCKQQEENAEEEKELKEDEEEQQN